MFVNPQYNSVLNELPQPNGKFAWKNLSRSLLGDLQQQGVDPKTIAKIIDETEKGNVRTFYNGSNSQNLHEMLLRLSQEETLSGLDKQNILERVFSEVSDRLAERSVLEQEYLSKHQSCYRLTSLGNPYVLKNTIPRQTLIKEVEIQFKNTIPLGEIRDFNQAYESIFAKSRKPTAILTYAAKMKSLGDPETIKCLGRFVTTVLNGDFKQVRYTENNPHLRKSS